MSDAPAPDMSVVTQSALERALALASGVLGALPAAKRGLIESGYAHGVLPAFVQALMAWMHSARLHPVIFARQFFGRDDEDPVVQHLHGAVLDAMSAVDHDGMRQASDHLAAAIEAVGVYRWPSFIRDAAERSNNPTTLAMLAKADEPTEREPGGIQLAAERTLDTTPTRFLDDNGEGYPDRNGGPMMRPEGLSPEFFVCKGLQDKELELSLLKTADGRRLLSDLGFRASVLSNFVRGGPWDAQRLGGVFRKEFVDYATVAIGLYAAATGLSREDILDIQNFVARNSHYDSAIEMDSVYQNLPKQNIRNTDLGYSLFQSGKIQCRGH